MRVPTNVELRQIEYHEGEIRRLHDVAVCHRRDADAAARAEASHRADLAALHAALDGADK